MSLLLDYAVVISIGLEIVYSTAVSLLAYFFIKEIDIDKEYYLRILPSLCIVYSSLRCMKYLSSVFFNFQFNATALVLLICIIISLVPSVVGVKLYKQKINANSINKEMEKMKIKDL